jgi:hypothetical protein
MLKDASPTKLPYAALSHRWGTKQHYTLTTRNLQNYLTGFDITDLPQTFQDASFVTKHLGMQYLWIDALCILQDSKEDWEVESLKMGDVFQGAEVVLAAHCSGDDSDGFLQTALSPGRAVLFCTAPTVYASLRYNYDADVTHSQLSRRGWVVQERFLATRTIHFTENHVYWDEPIRTRSEEGMVFRMPKSSVDKEGTRVRYFCPSMATELRSLLSQEHSSQDAGSETVKRTTLEWLDLVEMYSLCDLTIQGDKLIAIAGIAKVIQKKTGVSYCAGIWADTIAAGLLWLPQTERFHLALESRAPSWSWAAVDGPIQYPDDVRLSDFHPACKVTALNCYLVDGPDSHTPYWLDCPGSIALEAILIDLKSLIVKTAGWQCTEFLGPGLHQESFTIQHDDWFPRMMLHEFVPVHPIRDVREGGYGIVGWIATDTEAEREWRGVGNRELDAGELFFLVVGTRRRLVAGLFLRPMTPEGKTFRRVGMGQLHYNLLQKSGGDVRSVNIS